MPVGQILKKAGFMRNPEVMPKGGTSEVAVHNDDSAFGIPGERERQGGTDERLTVLRIRARNRDDLERVCRTRLTNLNLQVFELFTGEGTFILGYFQFFVQNRIRYGRNQVFERKIRLPNDSAGRLRRR